MTPESVSTTGKMMCVILCVWDLVIGMCVERKIKHTARLLVFMVLDDAYCLWRQSASYDSNGVHVQGEKPVQLSFIL
jgi:hypothetical protein